MNRIEDLITALQKKEEEKNKNTVLWVLAIIGAVAAIAGIAYAVYRFFTPDYLEDFEEDFDDDFDDYFEDEDEDEEDKQERNKKLRETGASFVCQGKALFTIVQFFADPKNGTLGNK